MGVYCCDKSLLPQFRTINQSGQAETVGRSRGDIDLCARDNIDLCACGDIDLCTRDNISERTRDY